MADHGACKHGITDTGKNSLGLILKGVAAAVAALNSAAMLDIANKQYDIAQDSLEISEWWRKYYNSYFKPVEDKELAEAQALKKETPLYDMAVGRARTYARLQFKGIAAKSIQCTSEYCTGLRAALLKDVVTQEATTTAAISNMGYRNERAYAEARNDVRWQRQFATAQRGRGMIANNVQFSQLAFGIFGDLGKQVGKGAAGAIRFLGYDLQRRDTMYPTIHRGRPEETRTPPFVGPPKPSAEYLAQSDPPEPTVTSGYHVDPQTGEIVSSAGGYGWSEE